MNICFLARLLPGRSVGGTGTYLGGVSRQLAQSAHKVFIVAAQSSKVTLCRSRDVDAVMVQLPRLSLPVIKTLVSNVLVLLKLYDLHKKSHFDVIQVEDFASAVLFYILRRCLFPDSFVVQSVHAAVCYEILFEGRYKARRQQNPCKRLAIIAWTYVNYVLTRALQALALGQCDLILSYSFYDKAQVRHFFGRSIANKVRVVPIGVDIGRFSPTSRQETSRKRLGLPLDRTIILSVRNLKPRMGLAALIEAVEHVRRRYPQVLLCIVGDGPLRAPLQRLVEDLDLNGFVYFAGRVSDEDLIEYYRAADLFVLPTEDLEGFGNVTLEALASGLPVLGTRKGATPELLTALSRELIINGTDPDAIGARLELWLNERHRFPSPAECREYVIANFSWGKVIQRYEALLVSNNR